MTGATSFREEASQRLSNGLRSLRSQGLLCDILLSSGSEQCLAHQVVLAASSKPLREHILASSKGQAPPSPELAAPPQRLEIKLDNASLGSKAGQALVEHVYGEDSENCAEDMAELSAALELGKIEAAELAESLQAMQAQGLLCDVLLSAGGEHIPAHQVVLASASPSLKRLIVDGMRQLGLTAADDKPAEVAAHTLELELRGVESAEAVKVLLDFLYGRERWADRKLSAEACRDVLHLASELRLPSLQDQGLQWSRKCKQASMQAEAAAAKDAADEPQEAGPSPSALPVMDEAAEEEPAEEQAGEEDGNEQHEEQPDTQAEKESAQVFLVLRQLRFNSKQAPPEPPTAGAVEAADAAGEIYSRADTNFLVKLVQHFWERPVWLGAALKKAPALGCGADPERLTRLLPFVAYQWKDGPWQNAYARLGWDPREEPEEAMNLQVIDFRDKHFRGEGKGQAKEVAEGTEDIFFKKAPTLRSQLYQLVDIEDDFVQSMMEGSAAEANSECDRRYGFLNQVIMETIHERLQIKSRDLREKASKRQAAPKRGARHSLPPRKRARVGGS